MKYVIRIEYNDRTFYLEKINEKYKPVQLSNFKFATVFNSVQEAMSLYSKYLPEIAAEVNNDTMTRVYIDEVKVSPVKNLVEIPNLFE